MISKDIVYEMIDDRVAYLQDCTKVTSVIMTRS